MANFRDTMYYPLHLLKGKWGKCGLSSFFHSSHYKKYFRLSLRFMAENGDYCHFGHNHHFCHDYDYSLRWVTATLFDAQSLENATKKKGT